MSEFLVEASTSADREAVERLLRAAGLPVAGLVDQFPSAYVVACVARELVGAAGLERYGQVGLLRSLAVAPSAKGQGLGRLLTFNRLRMAHEAGLEAVYLLTTTAADFFQRLGFEPTERARVPEVLAASPEFASICPASASCLVLRRVDFLRPSENPSVLRAGDTT